jgi:hypothetical protein
VDAGEQRRRDQERGHDRGAADPVRDRAQDVLDPVEVGRPTPTLNVPVSSLFTRPRRMLTASRDGRQPNAVRIACARKTNRQLRRSGTTSATMIEELRGPG